MQAARTTASPLARLALRRPSAALLVGAFALYVVQVLAHPFGGRVGELADIGLYDALIVAGDPSRSGRARAVLVR